MSKHRKRRASAGRRETDRGEPAEPKRPHSQVAAVNEGERLTTEERKRRFARNLDSLIGLLGMSRREVADEIGIPHKLVLRLVSTGVSRTDSRNVESLRRIASYFGVASVDDLWRADLLLRLLSTKEGGFVEKFRPRLLAERERQLAEEGSRTPDELALLSRALGFESAPPTLIGPWAAKVAAILASPKAAQFKRLIDDYYQLALATGSVKEDSERG